MSFKKYLSFHLLLIIALTANNLSLSAQNNPKINNQLVSEDTGMEMQEISIEKLPEKIRKNIADNFQNAKIVKAYKVWRPGSKKHEYWVDVLQGRKKWSLQFDDEGNAINKENP